MTIHRQDLTTNPMIRRVQRHANLTTLFHKIGTAGDVQIAPFVLGQTHAAGMGEVSQPSALPIDYWSTASPLHMSNVVGSAMSPIDQPAVITPAAPLPAADPTRAGAEAGSVTPQTTMLAETRLEMPLTQPASATPRAPATPPVVQAAPVGQHIAATAPPSIRQQSPLSRLPANNLPTPVAALAQPVVTQPSSVQPRVTVQASAVGSVETTLPAPVQPSSARVTASNLSPAALTDQSTVSESTDISEEDRNWARLQAIYRHHKTLAAGPRNEVTNTAPNTAPNTASSQPPAVQTSPARVRRPAGSEEGLRTLTSIQPAAGVPKAGLTPPAASEGEPPSLQRQETIGGEPTNVRESKPVQRASIPSISLQPALEDAVAQTTAPFEVEDAPTDSLSQTQEAGLPLEAVWPVQSAARLPVGLVQTEKASDEDQGTPARGGPASDAPNIRQRLEKVKTGQPTGSAVDIVVPRRPRPMGRPLTPTETPASAPLVQRASEGQGASAFPSSTEPSRASTPVAMIETEIGRLPADLWQLIGAPLPPEMPQTKPQPTTEIAIQRQTLDPVPTELGNARPAPFLASPEELIEEIPPADITTPVTISALDVAQTERTTAEPATVQSGAAELPVPFSARSSEIEQDQKLEQDNEILAGQVATWPPQNALPVLLEMAQQPTAETVSDAVPASSVAQPVQRSVGVDEPSVTQQRKRSPKKGQPRPATTTKYTSDQGLQRQASDDAPAALATLETPSAPDDTKAAPAKAPDIDIDDLARQVYTQLKRKLVVERERQRPTAS
ncbi:MAG: hypothetical protein NT075_08395 [Chloroflexi bacterium]|nr:hypothetical protein [Chloroflexota bacterium]